MAKTTTEVIASADIVDPPRVPAPEGAAVAATRNAMETANSVTGGSYGTSVAYNSPEVPVTRTSPADGSVAFQSNPAEESRLLARKARDSFRDACEESDFDSSEMSYLSARSALADLWIYTSYCDRGFRDLHALLDAAITRTDFASFDDAQKEAIRCAFAVLPRWIIDDIDVEQHIDRFTELDIDIIKPIIDNPNPEYRIIIEKI